MFKRILVVILPVRKLPDAIIGRGHGLQIFHSLRQRFESWDHRLIDLIFGALQQGLLVFIIDINQGDDLFFKSAVERCVTS